ncbi:MAG: prepilin-type N-terminal cleavage/methylation domain-containing protein [Promethearchaeota archaeon]
MKRECGFPLTELMVVVAIVVILSAIAIPMYMDNVRRTKVQEVVDTIGAIKDEIHGYISEKSSLPPPCNNHGQIRNTVGVQVPESGKWNYQIRNNGVIFAGARGSLGPGLRGEWIRCTPQVSWTNRVITSWQWQCDGGRIKRTYLPK